MKNENWKGPNEHLPLVIRVLMGLCPDFVQQHPSLIPLVEQYLLHSTKQLQTQLQDLLSTYATTGRALDEDLFWSVIQGMEYAKNQQNLNSLQELDQFFMNQKRAFGHSWRVARLRPYVKSKATADQNLTESLQDTCN